MRRKKKKTIKKTLKWSSSRILNPRLSSRSIRKRKTRKRVLESRRTRKRKTRKRVLDTSRKGKTQ